MSYNAILKVIPTLEATALLSSNVGFAKKKRKKVRGFADLAVSNVVGTTLIREQAKFI